MENLFESIIWLIVIAFWIISGILKKRTKQPEEDKRQPYPKPPPEPEKRTELEERILEALGFPVPKPAPAPAPPLVKKKPKLQPVILEKKPAAEIKAPPTPAVIKTEEKAIPAPLVFSPDKLEEGIILSTILGPPKSIEFRTKNQLLRKFLNLSS